MMKDKEEQLLVALDDRHLDYNMISELVKSG